MPAMSGAEPCTASKMDASLGGSAHDDATSITHAYPSNVARRGETETTNQACAHIRQNIAIKVRHHHDAVRIWLGILHDLFEGLLDCRGICHATKLTCRQARSNRSSSYEISGKSFDTWRQADKNMPSDIFLSKLIRDLNTRSCLGLHDISLVYRSHPFSPTGLRVVERVSSHAFRRFVSDELDGLNDPINNLKFPRKRE